MPLDTSPRAEAALDHVKALNRVAPVSVTLLHVLEPSAGAAGWDPLAYEFERGRAMAYLEEVASRLEGEVEDVQVAVVDGHAADAIARWAVEHDIDLVVLCAHGHGGPNGAGIGSVAHKLFSLASVSVLLARPGAPPPADDAGAIGYRRIVAPLDGSQRAEYALGAAGQLAKAHGAELLLCHVLTPVELLSGTLRSPEAQRQLARLMEANRTEAEAYLAGLAGRMTTEGIKARGVVHGQPDAPDHLHEAVAREAPDLVVLCAHGASGAGRLPYGRAVQTLARFGTSPILVVQDLEAGAVGAAGAAASHQRPGH